MFREWLEHIKAMAIFLICAQMMIHFRPKGTYVKYLRLLVSIMLLVQLLEPLGRLFGILDAQEFQRYVGEMERKMSQIQNETYFTQDAAENIWNILLQDVENEMTEGGTADTMPEREE